MSCGSERSESIEISAAVRKEPPFSVSDLNNGIAKKASKAAATEESNIAREGRRREERMVLCRGKIFSAVLEFLACRFFDSLIAKDM